MKKAWYVLAVAAVCGLGAGCGSPELKPTTDPDAIKREQERLRGSGPKAPKGGESDDPIKREQERLKKGG